MTPHEFFEQWQRLKNKFGKAMDDELKQLVSLEMKDMSYAGFKRAVDVFIGSRTPNKPPLLSEFREARLLEERQRLRNETAAAARSLYKHPGNIREVLKPVFGGVSSVKEALEIAKHKRLIARQNGDDPDGA
jgi:phosphoenolpyruvate carboxylase